MIKKLTTVVVGCAATLTFAAGVGVASGDRVEPVRPVAAAQTATPAKWAEDSLPPELYLWADGGRLYGPGRANRWANAYQVGDRHHTGCWAAVGRTLDGTTLIQCPDGFVAYS